MKHLWIVLVGFALVAASFGSDTKTVPLSEVAQHAVEQSKLTLPGGMPFHLKATIVETTNPNSTYKGEIEDWVSAAKWRHTISSPGFSQTLIVNGDRISEQDEGDYFPWWLNDLVTAIFDPLPMLDDLKKVSALLQEPSGSDHSESCARLQTKIGSPPAETSAFLVFCFDGRGLLKSVVTPGYDAEFSDYGKFQDKKVARRFTIYPEPGTAIQAKLADLRQLSDRDESMFAVPHATTAEEHIGTVMVSETVARALSRNAPDIVWPSVHSGKTSGVLSMYISVDRSVNVREAWPLNADNPGLEDAAREQVMKWQFKTAVSNGVPVQMETVLTFAFSTRIGNPTK